MDKFGLNFGLVIAYLIPGFMALYGIAAFSEVVEALLGGKNLIPSSSAVIPLVLLALATGALVNALAWAIIRPLIALTGVRRPRDLDYSNLKSENLDLYNAIVEDNFRYYQFYSNMLIALFCLAPSWLNRPVLSHAFINGIFALLCVILFFAGRDSLKRAYDRMTALTSKGGDHDKRKSGAGEKTAGGTTTNT